MNKGWPNDPFRHSLASRGIKTTHNVLRDRIKTKMGEKPPTEFQLSESEYSKGNVDKIIQLFWWCHNNDMWECFDFSSAFDVIKDILSRKLGRKFALPKQDLRNYWSDGRINQMKSEFDILLTSKSFERENLVKKLKENLPKKYYDFDIDEILYESDINDDILRKSIIEVFVEVSEDIESCTNWTPEYDELKEMYISLKNQPYQMEKKIALFDKAIDLEHHYGSLLGDWMLFDIPTLRKQFEEEYT